MFYRSLLIIIFSKFFILNIIFGIQLNLREEIYLLTNYVQIKYLFYENSDFNYYYKFESRDYSNEEIVRLLLNLGIKNFLLTGSKIKINIFYHNKFIKKNDFIDRIKSKYQITNITYFYELPEEFILLKFIEETSSNSLKINYSVVIFTNFIGCCKNYLLNIEIDNLETNYIEYSKNQQSIYIKNLRNGFADIVYYDGKVIIEDKVRIKRKVQDNLYLVENISSGRSLIVKSQE